MSQNKNLPFFRSDLLYLNHLNNNNNNDNDSNNHFLLNCLNNKLIYHCTIRILLSTFNNKLEVKFRKLRS